MSQLSRGGSSSSHAEAPRVGGATRRATVSCNRVMQPYSSDFDEVVLVVVCVVLVRWATRAIDPVGAQLLHGDDLAVGLEEDRIELAGAERVLDVTLVVEALDGVVQVLKRTGIEAPTRITFSCAFCLPPM